MWPPIPSRGRLGHILVRDYAIPAETGHTRRLRGGLAQVGVTVTVAGAAQPQRTAVMAVGAGAGRYSPRISRKHGRQ